MKRQVGFLVMLILLLSLITISCAQSSTPAPSPSSKPPPASSSTPATTPATAPTSAAPAAGGGVIKIGQVLPLTGNMAMTASLMVKSFDYAFEQVGYQVAGKKIQIITGDSKASPETAIDVARKMVENDKVAVINGAITVGENMGLAGYMNQAGIPQVVNAQLAVQTIPNNKWVIGAGGTPMQDPSAMATYVYDQLGYRTADVFTYDDAAGHAFLNAFIATFKNKGGQIVQETYTPNPCPDYASYLTVLKPADALATYTSGPNAITFLTQYYQMGIDKKVPLISAYHGSFLGPQVLNVLPPAIADATVGVVVPTPYTPALDTPFNKQWVPAIQAKVGMYPDDSCSGPYQSAKVIIEALKATNGDTTPEKLRQALLAVNVEGPEGNISFDPQTQVAFKNIYICKVTKQDKGYVWGPPIFTYKAVPAKGL